MSRFRIKRFKDWSIKFKLLVITGLLILGSVFLESFLSYYQYTRDFEAQSTDRVQQIIEQVSLNIDTYLDDLTRLSVAPYRNNEVMAALDVNVNDSAMEQLTKTRLIEDFLDEIMIIPRSDILTVFVLTDSVYSSGRVQTNIDSTVDFKNFDWYKESLTTQESILVPAHMQQIIKNPKLTVFSIVKQIRSTKDTEKILGVIKVDANYNGIEAIGNKVDLGKDGGLFIIDHSNTVIFSNVKGGHEADFFDLIGTKSNITVEVDHQEFLLNSTYIERSNWTVVAVSSVAELNKKASQTRNIAYLMAFISSFLAILVLFIFIRKFVNPLLIIVKLMKEINRGNLSVTFPEQRKDEIGYLGSSFNEMVHRIKDMLEKNTKLVSEVYEAKLLQKELQINALFNQIRPHFIFNTLNMISLLVQSNQQEKAVDHINKLSSILRSMAIWDKEITIQQEISVLSAYLSIQSSRFDGRMIYSIDIDKALYDHLIPALLFQPAVENAVIHGCEPKKDVTHIRIYNTEEKDTLIFHIVDDGKGMSKERLEKLQQQVDALVYDDQDQENRVGMGIGLVNVNKRIKMRYGVAYGLTIDSSPDVGTRVTITIPKI